MTSTTGQEHQGTLELQQERKEGGPVECLGLTFENDQARREHFLVLLKEKLNDPEFRRTPGFPNAEEEDILSLSNPPYYTACPNPFLSWLLDHRRRDMVLEYHREPFSKDLSEKRTTSIYTAHSYHTKVPPRAIAKLILHFTEPGDVVLDPFCGSGMTGVAAAMCADTSLATEVNGKAGHRVAILNDLSPAATFIAANYLCPPCPEEFLLNGSKLIESVDNELKGTWELQDGSAIKPILYIVWVEAFSCPLCQSEIVSQEVIKNTASIGTASGFPCPSCGALVSKAPTKGSNSSKMVRTLKTRFDKDLRKSIQFLNRVPLLAEILDGQNRRKIELTDNQRSQIESFVSSPRAWYPTDPIIEGERFLLKDCLAAYGIKYLHQLYLPRQLCTYSSLWSLADSHSSYQMRSALKFFVSSNALGMTVMNRYAPTHHSQVNRYFSGTLYIPSTVSETSHDYAYRNKLKRLVSAFGELRCFSPAIHAITTQSSTDLTGLPRDSIDYIFTDPPFGRNLQYSELNQVWEGWLKVHTNRSLEAVMDATRQREEAEYTALMKRSFMEMHRVLKYGRWITVEFHNSANSVWIAIQEAMSAAGFIVADVRVLDKESDTYKQSRQGLVKCDLVISAYKSPRNIEQIANMHEGSELVAWSFAEMHLGQLPVFIEINGIVQTVAERMGYMLFDRMVAFHVQRGIRVPLAAADFHKGLEIRYPQRDGMYFLPRQTAVYDTKRAKSALLSQLRLFVNDELSAIQWLRLTLAQKPQRFQDLQPEYMKEVQTWAKHEAGIELVDILRENFLHYDGQGLVPSQIHSYLSSNFKDLRNLDKEDPKLIEKALDRWYVPDPNKQADLDQIRDRALLKEFEELKDSTQRRIKQFRTEAVRAGFKACWQEKDYATIVKVAAKLPEEVLQEDEKLLMYIDNAQTRLGDD